jgi:hypothetical protein
VVSAKECRDLVTDCSRWAEIASHPAARQAFLAMAKTWTRTALELELADGHASGEPSQAPVVPSVLEEESTLNDRLAVPSWPASTTAADAVASSSEESAAYPRTSVT